MDTDKEQTFMDWLKAKRWALHAFALLTIAILAGVLAFTMPRQWYQRCIRLFLVIDNSESMAYRVNGPNGTTQSLFELVRPIGVNLVSALRSKDQVFIIQMHSNAQRIFVRAGRTCFRPQDSTLAARALRNLTIHEGGWGTAMNDAVEIIREEVRNDPRTPDRTVFVMLTDGAPDEQDADSPLLVAALQQAPQLPNDVPFYVIGNRLPTLLDKLQAVGYKPIIAEPSQSQGAADDLIQVIARLRENVVPRFVYTILLGIVTLFFLFAAGKCAWEAFCPMTGGIACNREGFVVKFAERRQPLWGWPFPCRTYEILYNSTPISLQPSIRWNPKAHSNGKAFIWADYQGNLHIKDSMREHSWDRKNPKKQQDKVDIRGKRFDIWWY
jgi:hypothetical protein